MYCSKCGVANKDDAQFCKGCGARLAQEKNVADVLKEKVDIKKVKDSFEKKTSSQKKRFLVLAAVILSLVVIFVVVGSFNRGPKRVVKDFFEAVYEGDVEGVLDAFPEDVIDRVIYEDFWNEEEFIEEVKDVIAEARYGMVDYNVKTRVTKVRDLTKEESLDLEDYYRNNYGFVAISDTKKVTIKPILPKEYKHLEDLWNERNMEMELDVIKVDGKWYIGNSMGDIF